MKTTRVVTLALAAIAGTAAAIFPQYSFVLVPVATLLGGWSTPHPADKQ